VARLVAMRVLVEGLPAKTLLNVNVPRQAPRGIRFTRLGQRVYGEKVVEQVDPRGRTHYWLGGGPAQWEALEGTDMGAVHEGFVAITPLHLDLTHHRALALMADWSGALDGQLRREADRPVPSPPARKKRARRV
jgi:5'-nucleotidase